MCLKTALAPIRRASPPKTPVRHTRFPVNACFIKPGRCILLRDMMLVRSGRSTASSKLRAAICRLKIEAGAGGQFHAARFPHCLTDPHRHPVTGFGLTFSAGDAAPRPPDGIERGGLGTQHSPRFVGTVLMSQAAAAKRYKDGNNKMGEELKQAHRAFHRCITFRACFMRDFG